MLKWIYIAVGGVTGTVARYWFSTAIYRKWGTDFPYGTLMVNVSGCLLIGLFHSMAEDKLWLGPEERILLMTGFCGAYTTFSTLILDTSNLMKGDEISRAFLNIAASLIIGFAFFRIGAWIGKSI